MARIHGTARKSTLALRERKRWLLSKLRIFRDGISHSGLVILWSLRHWSLAILRSPRLILPASLGLLLLAGCARHYNITLNNNHVITTYSKPKLNKAGDAFVFKDRAGHTSSVPAGNIKLIETQSHGPAKPEPMFKPSRS